ncbi:MAG: phosphatidic acid phosphatase [Firmicutes bacterium]|nr:phosphatidic acid phosphatase [Bacillota bacterium]
MRRTPVDYRGFSLKRLNEPRFSHLKLLGGWIFYFSLYFLTENLIPAEKCHPVHCFLDDLIPFNEFFLIFYVGWYALCVISLARTLFFDVESFKRLQTYIFITQVIAMYFYVVWPTRQDLRPEVFARDNFLTRFTAFIYSFDTCTGVSPSLHVAYSMGIMSVGLRDGSLSKTLKALLVIFVLLVCVAVCFVKQHSAVDVFTALPVCMFAEGLVYFDWWKERFAKRKVKQQEGR